MTPIYASERATIQGWYAYDVPRYSRRAFWDGGVGKRDNGATGFWCPYTGVIVDAPDKIIKAMPNICLDCALDGDDVIVTGFPRVGEILGMITDAFSKEVRYIYDEPGLIANFMDEVAYGADMLVGSPCTMVSVEKLPEDRGPALDYFRQHYPFGIVRHPYSAWTPVRTVFMATNMRPETTYEGRVREIYHHDGLDLIDFVTVWGTVEKELKVVPLYQGDDACDCPFWKIKGRIKLFTVEDLVVGYE